ncbi:MAG: hypothetical protein RL141_1004 [Candidatus Parcubacteria bacterium]|jgi:hypothetical protein
MINFEQRPPQERDENAALERLKTASTLGVGVERMPILEVKRDLESLIGRPLKNRSESHLTLITPFLSFLMREGRVSRDELVRLRSMEESSLPVLGLGSLPDLDVEALKQFLDTEPPEEKRGATFFAVVQLPDDIQQLLEELRLRAAHSFKERGEEREIYPVTPHVTVGFTEQDLFGNKQLNPSLPCNIKQIHCKELVFQQSKSSNEAPPNAYETLT